MAPLGDHPMKHMWLLNLVFVVCFSWSSTAHAYSIGSGLSTSCHERMSVDALTLYLEGLAGHSISLPRGDTWKGATSDVRGLIKGGSALNELLRDDELLFAAVSPYVGLRHPDTQGHSVTDLNALRTVHADPSPRAQYAHALRAMDDTGPGGDLQALAGTRQLVAEHLQMALTLFEAP